ncbi:hypothetical protein QJS10_CPA07g00362 [Acorus calamus]|uniref:Uncharacterized protein n=1 Tax=Acorus calamus TaxID=4465 RepID=A0AAV9EH11_ACOCL|nr:hypothetical protein QJS10_CPA07g00362 [Acorus calamus]
MRYEIDQPGWRIYQRPDENSGGHGVGWSPIIPYKFKVSQDWDDGGIWKIGCSRGVYKFFGRSLKDSNVHDVHHFMRSNLLYVDTEEDGGGCDGSTVMDDRD